MFDSSTFGLDPTGTTDNTTQIQAFLNACASDVGQLKPGTYMHGHVTIPSGAKVLAHGATSKAIGSLASNATLIVNASAGGTDADIRVEGLNVDGSALSTRTTALVAFLRVSRLRVSRIAVHHAAYTGLTFAGCIDAAADDIELHHCGNPTVSAEGGAALWLGVLGVNPGGMIRVSNPYIHDCEWAGIYATTDRVTVDGGLIKDCKEAGLFSNSSATNLKLHDLSVYGITKKYISGCGLELGGSRIDIAGGNYSETDASCISLTDCQDVVISGTTLVNPRRDSASFPTNSHIDVLSYNPSSPPSRTSIKGNTMRTTSGQSYAAVSSVVAGSGLTPICLVVKDNDMIGQTWASGHAVNIPNWSSSCVATNNAGA